MPVYVDDAYIRADVPNGAHTVRGKWCHMTADTRAELDAMATRIRLRREWIQHPGRWDMHYDLTMSKRREAVAAGAIEVGFREWTLEMVAQGQNRRDRIEWGSQDDADLCGHATLCPPEAACTHRPPPRSSGA